MIDVALLVPFQSEFTSWIDPTVRRALAATYVIPMRARHRFEEYLGRTVSAFDPPEWGGTSQPHAHRSATAITLASSLERAGLGWKVLDPGARSLSEWRQILEGLAPTRPRLVAVSTTFVSDGFWIGSLCALVRRFLPDATLALGGYYYATDTRRFLSLDADVFCVGEGDERLADIALAVRDGRPLDGIPGLYLRGPDGLRFTGPVEPLDLERVPLPDWSLSSRIDPPVDLALEAIRHPVETQRGCVFKCDFCTFRTLAAPVEMSVERAVRAIEQAGQDGRGTVFIVDGTGTYPHDRWRRILEALVERGRSRSPISVYARVNDLDDSICALMAKAGVRHVYIGQETGDQDLLNVMKKGTRVDQVRPAIDAIARHGIAATVAFLYGFPGETEASMRATRRMVASLNDGHEDHPVVFFARVGVFAAQDFSGAAQRDSLAGNEHRFGYDHLPVSAARAAEESISTHLELSKIPHAPTTGFDVNQGLWDMLWQTTGTADEATFFRWMKAFDRGIGVFVEEDLEGKRPDLGELRRLKEIVLASYPEARRRAGLAGRLATRIKNRMVWQVTGEWRREERSGPGPLTRLLLGYATLKSLADPLLAAKAIRDGAYPTVGMAAEADAHAGEAETLATDLIRQGVATGKRKLVRITRQAREPAPVPRPQPATADVRPG